MEQIQKNTDRLSAREKLLERVKNFTLLSDVFLSVALRDKAACQHVLRLLTGKEKLTVESGQNTIPDFENHLTRCHSGCFGGG